MPRQLRALREHRFAAELRAWHEHCAPRELTDFGRVRESDRDFRRFIIQAIGSVDECVACLDIALNEGFFDRRTHEEMCGKAEKIGRQLVGLSVMLAKVDGYSSEHPSAERRSSRGGDVRADVRAKRDVLAQGEK